MGEVSKLMQISDSKATGTDEVPIRYIKLAIKATSILIRHIINAIVI